MGLFLIYGSTNAIKELSSEESISIYPNPSSEIFTVSSSEKISQIEIYNLLGEKTYSEKIAPIPLEEAVSVKVA